MDPVQREWRKVTSYVLEGTYLEVHLQSVHLGSWIVVDGRKPNRLLGAALDLRRAKKLAEQLAAARPGYVYPLQERA